MGSSPGVIDGGEVRGILAGQLHFPPTLPANPANPIDAWSALWTTSDFRPRSVGLSTGTLRFDLYVGTLAVPIVVPGPAFGEGTAEVLIVPGPGAAALLLALTRRRRCDPVLDMKDS